MLALRRQLLPEDTAIDSGSMITSALEASRPSGVLALEGRLAALRNDHAAKMSDLRAHLEKNRKTTPNRQRLTAEETALEGDIQKLDDRMESLRRQLIAARLDWSESLVSAMKPQLRDVGGHLREAADLLEKTAQALAIVDKFILNNGLELRLLSRALPPIRDLRELANWLAP